MKSCRAALAGGCRAVTARPHIIFPLNIISPPSDPDNIILLADKKFNAIAAVICHFHLKALYLLFFSGCAFVFVCHSGYCFCAPGFLIYPAN
jgi:hypothetical protein